MSVETGRARAGWRRRPPEVNGEDLVRSLYQEHGSLLLAYVTRLTGDRHLAEDVVQETLVRAWRHRDQLTSERGSIRGWLLTVARNIVTDKARARKARPHEVAQTPQDPPVAGDHAEEVATAMTVASSLRTLSPEHRDALVEVYLRGRSVAEAAQVLGIPEGTVKSRVHHALRALRKTLGAAQDGAS